jgi:hypothetical protein
VSRWTLAALLILSALSSIHADGPSVDTMDEVHFRAPRQKAKIEQVEGKMGKAVRFTFEKDARTTFCTSALRSTPAWDEAAGLSFWVKGDGSAHLGGLEPRASEALGQATACGERLRANAAAT